MTDEIEELKAEKKRLNNSEFMEILKKCCSDGHIDDEKFNFVLSNYFPYNLVFKEDLRKNDG